MSYRTPSSTRLASQTAAPRRVHDQPNRRVRTRTHGGVGGDEPQGSPLSQLRRGRNRLRRGPRGWVGTSGRDGGRKSSILGGVLLSRSLFSRDDRQLVPLCGDATGEEVRETRFWEFETRSG